ncbi:MAG: leucine-rich repeat protein [Alistipes sp.]
MKKLLLFFTVVATMFAACSKDATNDAGIDLSKDKFYVSISNEDESRVQLDEECQTVWNADDQVSVFNKTTDNRCYKFTGQTGDKTGELVYVEGGATGSVIDKVVALYPYDSAAVLSEGLLQTTIPATQQYVANSFGKGGNIMVAQSDDENLAFKHLFGWIKLQLSGNYAVKSITLAGLNNESLAGSATIADDLGITLADDATDTLTLDCGDGVQLTDTPTAFYIAVIPQTFENGVDITINLVGGGCYSKSIARSLTVDRNHIVPVKNLEKRFSTITYTTTDGNMITIDESKFDVTIASHTYTDGQGVILFDGEPTTIGEQAFRSCSTLESISIPDTITEIGSEAFYECGELCTGGVHITDIEAWCKIQFGDMSANPLYYAGDLYLNGQLVTDVIIPNSITSIGFCTFVGCGSITNVTINDNVTTIEPGAFYECTGLTTISIGQGVTEIGECAFCSCINLTSITIPNNVKIIGEGSFQLCEKLANVTISDGVTTIGDYAFWWCIELKNATIGSGVTSIGHFAFNNCTELTNIYCKPTTPPTLGAFVFSGIASNAKIYVPSASASAYQAATNWSDYSSIIVGYDF